MSREEQIERLQQIYEVLFEAGERLKDTNISEPERQEARQTLARCAEETSQALTALGY